MAATGGGVSKTLRSHRLAQANAFGGACDAAPWSHETRSLVWDWDLI
jgi:hypothetical protein